VQSTRRREPFRESLENRLKGLQNCGIIEPRKAVKLSLQFIFTFLFIYSISAIIGQHMRMFSPEPKLILIPSPVLYNLLIFPSCLIRNRGAVRKKDRGLTFSELLFCTFNQIALVGTAVLQLIPALPCAVVEITFGRRYRWMDVTLDTFNQKIPLAAILTLLCVELLVLAGDVLIRAVRDADFRKKLGAGLFIGLLVFCLAMLAGLIFSLCLLF